MIKVSAVLGFGCPLVNTVMKWGPFPYPDELNLITGLSFPLKFLCPSSSDRVSLSEPPQMTEHVTDEVLLGEMQLADNQLRLGAPFSDTHTCGGIRTLPLPSSSLPHSLVVSENKLENAAYTVHRHLMEVRPNALFSMHYILIDIWFHLVWFWR